MSPARAPSFRLPNVAHRHGSRETYFACRDGVGVKPNRDIPSREWAERPSNGVARPPWSDRVIAALRQRCAGATRPGWLWRIPRRARGVRRDGRCRARIGRDPPHAGWPASSRTCVQGEPAQARETALRRLAQYTNGENRGAVCAPRRTAGHAAANWTAIVADQRAPAEDRRCPIAPAPLRPKCGLSVGQTEIWRLSADGRAIRALRCGRRRRDHSWTRSATHGMGCDWCSDDKAARVRTACSGSPADLRSRSRSRRVATTIAQHSAAHYAVEHLPAGD